MNLLTVKSGDQLEAQTELLEKLITVLKDGVMPPADDTTAVTVHFQFSADVLEPGQFLNFRFQARNNSMRVVATDVDAGTAQLTNIGHRENALPGTSILWATPVYLQVPTPTLADVSDNFFDLRQPTLAPVSNPTGITVNARGRVERNIILDARVGINIYVESRTPLFPSADGMLIKDNYIRPRDTSTGSVPVSHGIFTWAPNPVILDNRISFPISTRTGGIAVGDRNALIFRNVVFADDPVIQGYTSFLRGVGITFVNANSVNARLDENLTRGFDVGVGPSIPFQEVPYRVISHTSLDDQLGIDPIGLVTD